MSVINCLPRNDAAISRDRCKPPPLPIFLLPTSHLSSSDPSTFLGPFSFIPLLFPPVRSSRVRSFVRTSLARPAPPPSFLSFFLFFDRQRGLVMHLNNLFISDSTLRATRALVIMRGKHSRVPRERVGRFFPSPPSRLLRASYDRFLRMFLRIEDVIVTGFFVQVFFERL